MAKFKVKDEVMATGVAYALVRPGGPRDWELRDPKECHCEVTLVVYAGGGESYRGPVTTTGYVLRRLPPGGMGDYPYVWDEWRLRPYEGAEKEAARVEAEEVMRALHHEGSLDPVDDCEVD